MYRLYPMIIESLYIYSYCYIFRKARQTLFQRFLWVRDFRVEKRARQPSLIKSAAWNYLTEILGKK